MTVFTPVVEVSIVLNEILSFISPSKLSTADVIYDFKSTLLPLSTDTLFVDKAIFGPVISLTVAFNVTFDELPAPSVAIIVISFCWFNCLVSIVPSTLGSIFVSKLSLIDT